jgi:hypothetical protein
MLLFGVISCGTFFKAQASVYNFYGHWERTQSDWVDGNNPILNAPLTQTNVDRMIALVEKQDLSRMVSDLQTTANTRRLDAVGIILLAKSYVRSTYLNTRAQKIIQWKILQKMGFDVLLSYDKSQFDVFGRMPLDPASSVYIHYKGARYNNLDFHNGRLTGNRFIYGNSYKPGSKPILFNTSSTPLINALEDHKQLNFEHAGKKYTLRSVTNKSLVKYLDDLPRLSLGITYVQKELSAQAQQSVIAPLNAFMANMSEAQKAAFLLSFVQQAFAYKTDLEQYGYEKYNYPEESLQASYVDCEDKTLLLAYLYKEILHADCVLLLFEERQHVCLGVSLEGYTNSYAFRYNDKNYLTCEPTGTNYHLGRTAIPLTEVSQVIPL